MRRLAAAAVLVVAAAPARGGTAVYFAHGRDASLFDQYDVDGYSLAAVPESSGVRLVVRTAPTTTASRARASAVRPEGLVPAPDRDRLALALAGGATLEEDRARAILDWVRRSIAYDADRSLPQEPAAVFADRRAYCVGFAELAVDLLRRAGIAAETVQGIHVSDPSAPGYAAELSGAYHRWVRIFYRDRGWRFADPLSADLRVDAHYVPFARRSWTRPGDLRLEVVSGADR